MDPDNCVVMARGKEGVAWGPDGGGQRGEGGDICNSVNSKNKEKRKKKLRYVIHVAKLPYISFLNKNKQKRMIVRNSKKNN